MNKSQLKKILIFRVGHLGDTLVSLPAMWAIRKAFPETEITLLTNVDAQNSNFVTARAILPENGLIDKWILYPNNLSRVKTKIELARLWIKVRSERYDAVFYLMTRNRPVSVIRRDRNFFKLAGVERFFCGDALEKGHLPERPPPPLPVVESESEFLLNALPSEFIGLTDGVTPDLRLTAEEIRFAENWIVEKCVPGKRYIAVAPGSKWESKIWSEARFADVIARLIGDLNVFPIVFGGGEDAEKGVRLMKVWKTGANAAGELNIRQAAAALSKCEIYVGNDTGTMHLAASVGTPCVGIFAAIDYPGRWHPFGKNHIIFRESVECEGCHTELCPRGNLCLEKITAESVFRACKKMLAGLKL